MVRLREVSAAAVVAACCHGGNAWAEDVSEATGPPASAAAAPSPQTEEAPRWYGWQILLLDAANLGLAAAVREPGIWYVTVPVYLLDGVAVHVVHERGLAAGASLGARFTFPLAGGFVGRALAGDCAGFMCGVEELIVGSLVGVGAAIALDVGALSWKRAAVERDVAVSVVPTRDRGAVLAVAATF